MSSKTEKKDKNGEAILFPGNFLVDFKFFPLKNNIKNERG
jgi:hypothetical protein